jgi:hypothetical protein
MNNKLQREPLSRPGEPTDAAPGSTRKIRVLTERAARRESLFHPKDNLKRLLPSSPPDSEPEPEEEAELDLLETDEDDEDGDVDVEIDLAG